MRPVRRALATALLGPNLITAYDGSPTAFGIGFRQHLRALAQH